MPFDLSMNAVLAIFYIIFLGQVFLLSVHFPNRFIARYRYVIDNFPPSEYPKLYPNAGSDFKEVLSRKLHRFKAVNNGIATLGLMVLIAMGATGYQPDVKGGDEIFVLLYFFLQAAPFLVAALLEHKQYKALRNAFAETKRKADLRRRHLFDFISPFAVLGAIVCFIAWITYYLSVKGWTSPWSEEVYISVSMTFGMNLIYAFIIARFLYGKKIDPYQATKDQLKTIEATITVLIYSSIGISLFNMISVAADEYALEVFDPPLSSLYFQFCAFLGFGVMLAMTKVESIDFEVYRDDTATG